MQGQVYVQVQVLGQVQGHGQVLGQVQGGHGYDEGVGWYPEQNCL